MRIAFYGIMRQVGTSANMAAVSAGLAYYFKSSVLIEEAGGSKIMSARQSAAPYTSCVPLEQIILTDCRRNERPDKIIRVCDLLVLNLSIPCPESEYLYFRHLSIQKNVVFLIGKYHKNQLDELKSFIYRCRIDPMQICAIPYNLRFQRAYENQNILKYIAGYEKNAGSYEAFVFGQYLKHTVHTIMNFKNRKEEL